MKGSMKFTTTLTAALLALPLALSTTPASATVTSSFATPGSIAISGNHAYVVSQPDPSAPGFVTEVNAATGQITRTFTGSMFNFTAPALITIAGSTGVIGYNNTIVEFSLATGKLIRKINAPKYHLAGIDAIATNGPNIFVAGTNEDPKATIVSSVTEFNAATGALVNCFYAPKYHLNGPTGFAFSGSNLFVSSYSSVTEINAATGAVVRVLSAPNYQFSQTSGIMIDGPNAFVANNKSVTEFNASTGALVRVIAGPSYRFDAVSTLVPYGSNIYATSIYNSTVTEFHAATGALVQVLSNKSYGLNQPVASAIYGSNIFVVSLLSSGITEINAATGALVQILGQ